LFPGTLAPFHVHGNSRFSSRPRVLPSVFFLSMGRELRDIGGSLSFVVRVTVPKWSVSLTDSRPPQFPPIWPVVDRAIMPADYLLRGRDGFRLAGAIGDFARHDFTLPERAANRGRPALWASESDAPRIDHVQQDENAGCGDVGLGVEQFRRRWIVPGHAGQLKWAMRTAGMTCRAREFIKQWAECTRF
jgi:hypothetical protein